MGTQVINVSDTYQLVNGAIGTLEVQNQGGSIINYIVADSLPEDNAKPDRRLDIFDISYPNVSAPNNLYARALSSNSDLSWVLT